MCVDPTASPRRFQRLTAASQTLRAQVVSRLAASVRRGIMTLLTQAMMFRAHIDVDRMSAQQKVELADEIYVQQPNLLAPILVLPRYGVEMLQLEVPIYVLLVALQAMKHYGHAMPTIAEDIQEVCSQRLRARMKFTEGVPPALVAQMITNSCVDQPMRLQSVLEPDALHDSERRVANFSRQFAAAPVHELSLGLCLSLSLLSSTRARGSVTDRKGARPRCSDTSSARLSSSNALIHRVTKASLQATLARMST